MIRRSLVLSVVSITFLLFLTPASLSAHRTLFKPVVDYETGDNVNFSLAVADLNGDGKLDVVTIDFDMGTVAVFLGKGNGTFQPPQTYSAGLAPRQVVVADVNNDGKPDLIVAELCYDPQFCNGVIKGAVGVLLGNGDGTFQPMQTYPSGFATLAVAVGDFNRDGNLDLIVANECDEPTCSDYHGAFVVLLGDGTGAFREGQSYSTYAAFQDSIAVADVNGDGILDVLVANGYVNVLLGNGDGTFQPAQVYSSGSQGGAVSIAVADVNGDGKPDLVVADSGEKPVPPGAVSVLLGNGDGTFQPAQTFYTGGRVPTSVAVADVNGDGKLDLLVSNSERPKGKRGKGSVGVLLGNGDGTFQTPTVSNSGGYSPQAIAIADLNGDLLPDVVVVNLGVVGVLLHWPK